MKQFTPLLFTFLLLLNCSEKETPDIIPSGNEKISLKIDDDYYVVKGAVTVIYYQQYLTIETDSLVPLEDGESRFYFKLYGNTDGSDKFEFLKDIYFQLREYSNTGSTSLLPDNGHVKFTEFDTLSRNISGTFSASLEAPDGSISYTLSEGKFNSLDIMQLYCEPYHSTYKHDTTSIYNRWGLVGISDEEGNFDYPPCNSKPQINIYPKTEDPDFENFRGTDSSNSFIGQASFDEENQTFTIGDVVSTLSFTSLWNSDYDRKFWNILLEENARYQFSSTELIIINDDSDLKMVFVPVE